MLRRFVGFWVDFVVGDAWEVAVGIGLSLVVVANLAARWDGRQALGFVLLGMALGLNAVALLRAATRASRANPTVAVQECNERGRSTPLD